MVLEGVQGCASAVDGDAVSVERAADILRRGCFAGTYREMLLVRGLAFSTRSTPYGYGFNGHVCVGYVPAGIQVTERAIGGALSALAQSVAFQEQLTVRFRDVLREVLRPRGVAVFVTARHEGGSAEKGGVRGLVLTTRAVSGVFEDQAMRSEFLRLIHR